MTNLATAGICIALNELLTQNRRLIELTVKVIAEMAGLEVCEAHPRTIDRVIIPEET